MSDSPAVVIANETGDKVVTASEVQAAVGTTVRQIVAIDTLTQLSDGTDTVGITDATTPSFTGKNALVAAISNMSAITIGTVNQGTPAAASDAWPVKVSNGTDTAGLVAADSAPTFTGLKGIVAAISNFLTVTLGSAFGTSAVPIAGSDGTNARAVKTTTGGVVHATLPNVEGTVGSTAPTVAALVGGNDGTNLRAIKTSSDGTVAIAGSVTGTTTATLNSDATPGSAVPATAQLVAGSDGTDARALTTSTTGTLFSRLRALFAGTETSLTGYQVESMVGTSGRDISALDVYAHQGKAGDEAWQVQDNLLGYNLPGIDDQRFAPVALSADSLAHVIGKVTRAGVYLVMVRNAADLSIPLCARIMKSTPTSAGAVVTMTNGSTAVTGVGTAFLSLAINQYIWVTSNGALYAAKIASIESDTALTLSAVYDGTTGSGVPASVATLVTSQVPGWPTGLPLYIGPLAVGDVISAWGDTTATVEMIRVS